MLGVSRIFLSFSKIFYPFQRIPIPLVPRGLRGFNNPAYMLYPRSPDNRSPPQTQGRSIHPGGGTRNSFEERRHPYYGGYFDYFLRGPLYAFVAGFRERQGVAYLGSLHRFGGNRLYR